MILLIRNNQNLNDDFYTRKEESSTYIDLWQQNCCYESHRHSFNSRGFFITLNNLRKKSRHILKLVQNYHIEVSDFGGNTGRFIYT